VAFDNSSATRRAAFEEHTPDDLATEISMAFLREARQSRLKLCQIPPFLSPHSIFAWKSAGYAASQCLSGLYQCILDAHVAEKQVPPLASTQSAGEPPDWGKITLSGAAVGGLAGAQIGKGKGQLAMTALGALLGAFAGSSVGSSLDKADQAALERSTVAALNSNRIGKPITWRNPRTGNRGTVTAINQTVTSAGYCREYQQVLTIGGREENAFGVACRQPDGSWQIGA